VEPRQVRPDQIRSDQIEDGQRIAMQSRAPTAYTFGITSASLLVGLLSIHLDLVSTLTLEVKSGTRRTPAVVDTTGLNHVGVLLLDTVGTVVVLNLIHVQSVLGEQSQSGPGCETNQVSRRRRAWIERTKWTNVAMCEASFHRQSFPNQTNTVVYTLRIHTRVIYSPTSHVKITWFRSRLGASLAGRRATAAPRCAGQGMRPEAT